MAVHRYLVFIALFCVVIACRTNCDIVLPPVRISEIHPVYTVAAKEAKVEGIIILKLTIDRMGKVSDVQVEQGLPYGLTEWAIESTRALHFKPAYRKCNGDPVSCLYTLALQYSLSSVSSNSFERDLAITKDAIDKAKKQNNKDRY